MALKDKATAYYSFDGTFLADATGRGNVLTDTAGIPSGNLILPATGKIGQGADFPARNEATTNAFLSAVQNDDTKPPGTMSLALWFNSVQDQGTIMLDGSGQGSIGFWIKQFFGDQLLIEWLPDNSGSASWLFTVTHGTWNLLTASIDLQNLVFRTRLNNGTVNTAAIQAGDYVQDLTQVLALGAEADGFGSHPWIGELDEVSIFGGYVLTGADEDFLWNGGAGRNLFETQVPVYFFIGPNGEIFFDKDGAALAEAIRLEVVTAADSGINPSLVEGIMARGGALVPGEYAMIQALRKRGRGPDWESWMNAKAREMERRRRRRRREDLLIHHDN